MIDNEIKLWEESFRLADAIKTTTQIIKDIVANSPACSCIDAYKARGMTDPDCYRCNGADLSRAEAWLKERER